MVLENLYEELNDEQIATLLENLAGVPVEVYDSIDECEIAEDKRGLLIYDMSGTPYYIIYVKNKSISIYAMHNMSTPEIRWERGDHGWYLSRLSSRFTGLSKLKETTLSRNIRRVLPL